LQSLVVRGALARIFQVPKRAGLKVIQQLVVEFPDLAPLLPRMQTRSRSSDRAQIISKPFTVARESHAPSHSRIDSANSVALNRNFSPSESERGYEGRAKSVAASWQKPFLPEKLTPLRLTPSWTKFSTAERLRYNQLQGLYFHEQIIFFEQQMIVPLINAARGLVTDPLLRASLTTFVAEEDKHSAQFHAVLRELRQSGTRRLAAFREGGSDRFGAFSPG